jgi:2-C-methyl-D-erythritol 2,4-cyclodiphosphate synthase
MLIGIGYDIHRLVEGRALFLGGVKIPYFKGLYGYSDGDVLLHAIADALLGAIGGGDLGRHFPDTDPRYKNISSLELLKMVYELVKKKGYHILNIDSIIIADKPFLEPFKSQMEENIAKAINLRKELINIKAKTEEGLGYIGRQEAIASYAVALVEQT